MSYVAVVQCPQCLIAQVILSVVTKASHTASLLYRAGAILVLQLLTLLKTNTSLGGWLLLNQSTSQVLCEDMKYWLHPSSQKLAQTAAPLSLAILFLTLHTKLLCLTQSSPQGPFDKSRDIQQLMHNLSFNLIFFQSKSRQSQ